MRLTWRAGLHLAAAGSAITLITMIGSVPVSASPGGKPGPAGLLPAVRGLQTVSRSPCMSTQGFASFLAGENSTPCRPGGAGDRL